MTAASPPEPLPRFGRYEALFRIASGGMAEVFAARLRGEAGFEKLVAVKRMLPHMLEDEAFVDMFLDEARVAVHVQSPYVVQTLDLGRADDGALYIAMELVIGASLSVLIRESRRSNQRVPLPVALEILAQAAQGLDDAHEAVTPAGVHLGIVHRDVSPHNLLIGVDGRTRVSDFGIARAMLRRTSTAAGELKGKFAYFSPEQAEGRQVDRRADVFALGIVAWECLIGKRLFQGGDMLQTLALVKGQDIPLLHALDRAIPASVGLAVARALARPVDDRFSTAGEMAQALREAARELGPTPTSREIGRWVSETGGEVVAKIRTQLDAAHGGDDAPTVARESSRSDRSGSSASRSDRSGSSASRADRSGSSSSRLDPSGSSPSAASPALAPAPQAATQLTAAQGASTAEPSTVAGSVLPPGSTGGSSRAVAIGAAAVAVAAVVSAGLAWSMRGPSPEAKLAAADSADARPAAASAAPPASASAPPAASAASPGSSAADATPAKVLPKGKTSPKEAKAPAAGPGDKAPQAAPPEKPEKAAQAAPAAPAPPPADTPKKGPTGPLLGDDAFK